MACGDADSEAVVKKALEDFLKEHGGEESLSSIDEYAMSYILSILTDLSSGETDDEAFDIDDFTEMMQGFVPAFSAIDNMTVTKWLFGLAGSMKNKPQNGGASLLSFCPPQSEAIAIDTGKSAGNKKKSQRVHTTSGGSTASLTESSPRSSVSASSAPSVGGSMEDDHSMHLLTDMFPAACRLEVTHCLSTAEGDVDRAAQLLLDRQDSGEAITMDDHAPAQPSGKKNVRLNDKDMKKHIVNKYSFVDTEADKRDHRPVMPKKESKKMVRYLDNRVVSTKGERFTEIKKDPEEEQKMKHTYVNLKPAKQYRFH